MELERYAYWAFNHMLRVNPALPLTARDFNTAVKKIKATAALLYTLAVSDEEEGVLRFLSQELVDERSAIGIAGSWSGIGSCRRYAKDEGGYYAYAIRRAIDAALFDSGMLRLSLDDANKIILAMFPHTWRAVCALINCQNLSEPVTCQGEIALAVLREWDVFYKQFNIPKFTERMARDIKSHVEFAIDIDCGYMTLWTKQDVDGDISAIDDNQWHFFSGTLENAHTECGEVIRGVGWYVSLRHFTGE